MLTIDGGGDWTERAWPVIRRNGFTLHAFLATDRVADWQRIVALAEEGVGFGSGLATGRAADALTCGALLDEAIRSRLVLEHVLDAPVATVAPPGLSDVRIERLLSAAGYARSFLECGGLAPVAGQLLRTPRIRIADECPIARFAELLGSGAEPPEEGDLP